MKQLHRLLGIALICFAGQTMAFGPFAAFKEFFEKDWDSAERFTKQVEKHIAELQKRKAQAVKVRTAKKSSLETVQKSIKRFIERAQRVHGAELEYVNLQVTLLNASIQVLSDILQVYQDVQDIISGHIKLLQEYKNDPEFKAKGFQVEPKSIYSIDDFQQINNIVLRYVEELRLQEERLHKLMVDYPTLKKNQALARQEYEEKKREQKELKAKTITEERLDRKKLSLQQQGALFDTEERLLALKIDLADAKIMEADEKTQYLEQSIKITKFQLEVLEKEEEHVRHGLLIEKKDLNAAQEALNKQVQESNRLVEGYTTRIETLNGVKQDELKKINQLQQRAHLSEANLDAFYQWSFQPSSLAEWNRLIGIGRIHNRIVFKIDILRDTLLTQIDHAKAKVTASETNNLIIQSWYNVTTGKFDDYRQDELLKEIKHYEKTKAGLQSSIVALADKRTAASNMLNNHARVAENIKARLKSFREQKDTIFKNNANEFNRLGLLLKREAFEDTQERGESIAQLIELYTTVINFKDLTIKKIDAMLSVLSAKAQWQGVPPLVKGLKKFIPDITKFFQYLAINRLGKSIANTQLRVGQWFKGLKASPLSGVAMLLYLLIAFVVYVLLKFYLPELALLFTNVISPRYGFARVLFNFLASILHFIAHHLKGMYLWVLFLLLVRYHIIDPYMGVLFYLFSIPFWLYWAYRFVSYLQVVNSAHEYVFASKRSQQRFFRVFSFFLYATVVILLLREAILLAYPQLDVPRILLALNFIVLQVSLIFMITREQLLSLIPRTTPLWQWIYEQLDKYYYLFLAALAFIILMSNPYIGYGPNFLYAITRLVLILLLIPLFNVLHSRVKQFAGSFFFYSDEEGIKERFPYGKTSYGLFIIASFLFFTVLSLILAANIWGYSVGWEDIWAWLHKGLYGYTNPATGRYETVNFILIVKVFLYVLGGVALAYIVNQFMLRRMFDLLLVNIGVQSAILSLTSYLIVFTAIIIGFQKIGLSSPLFYVFVVLGGLGVAGKEIITDFIGYFIILIQRPIKIGDLIKIDSDMLGVVRRLTFRSIAMRKQNSVTVIIPNSFIMTRPITNWNYSRTYFAFEDILLTAVYTADPAIVKKLLLDVLDRNPHTLKNPSPVVRLNDFTDNGFQFLIRGFLSPDKVLEQYDIASDVRLELVRVLRLHGYDVASPTRVLRLVQEKPKEDSEKKE